MREGGKRQGGEGKRERMTEKDIRLARWTKKAKHYKSRLRFIKQKTIDRLKSIFAHLSREKANSEYLHCVSA